MGAISALEVCFAEKVRAGGALEVTKDDMDIVSAVRTALAGKVGKERFELWFGGGTQLEVVDGGLTVGAPSEFQRDWLRTTFRHSIEIACREVLGPAASVVFGITSSSPDSQFSPVAQVTAPPSAAPSTSSDNTPAAGGLKLAATPEETSSAQPSEPKRQRRREGAIDFRTFVRGRTNKLARAAAEMVAGQPGEFSPLLIHGPTSVGKTHLLQAICTEARRNTRNLAAVYLSAEQFTSEFLQALRGGGLPSFRAG